MRAPQYVVCCGDVSDGVMTTLLLLLLLAASLSGEVTEQEVLGVLAGLQLSHQELSTALARLSSSPHRPALQPGTHFVPAGRFSLEERRLARQVQAERQLNSGAAFANQGSG